MEVNLKPCPFCGGEVELYDTGLKHWRYAIKHKDQTDCIAKEIVTARHNATAAQEAWNRRAEESQTAQQKSGPAHFAGEKSGSGNQAATE